MNFYRFVRTRAKPLCNVRVGVLPLIGCENWIYLFLFLFGIWWCRCGDFLIRIFAKHIMDDISHKVSNNGPPENRPYCETMIIDHSLTVQPHTIEESQGGTHAPQDISFWKGSRNILENPARNSSCKCPSKYWSQCPIIRNATHYICIVATVP